MLLFVGLGVAALVSLLGESLRGDTRAALRMGLPVIPHLVALFLANGALVLLAARLYAAQHGKLPSSAADLVPNLKVEILEPVSCRGYPRSETFAALDQLAATIAERHVSKDIVGH